MRLIHVLVSDEQRDPVLSALDDRNVTYVVLDAEDGGEGDLLVEFPLPNDGTGDVMDALGEAGLDETAYTVVGTAETATTATMAALEDRYSGDFDPLTRQALRSKAKDMSHDLRSFVWMILLSAIIATAGLLVNSPAVVVGSMVIAPMVGPVLTASVGTVTGDREMLADSVRLQVIGLVVAVVTATAFSYVLRTFSFVPMLEISAIGQISSRVAPSLLTVAVGLASGSAAAFGLTTKGPTSLIGVMIAAALIPAAGTAGIAVVWGYPTIAVGSLLLLAVSLVAINVSSLATLWYLGYRPRRSDSGLLTFENGRRIATFAVGAVAIALVVGAAVVGTYQQVGYERAINQEIESVLDDPEYANLTLVQTSIEYGFVGELFGPETVTVTISRTADGEFPDLADRLQRRIVDRTGQRPALRVTFVDYEVAEASPG
ncbi:TIGR00341 family protein [Halorussus marinus]|uniref:TIGR00341 family protein n=1 Tax=Halorussus marinus TaxID=2505976 RepID=UPI00106ED10B|nr:TIGR00341 family protein [Halorussus marinus]